MIDFALLVLLGVVCVFGAPDQKPNIGEMISSHLNKIRIKADSLSFFKRGIE